jgi:hypothetical protein
VKRELQSVVNAASSGPFPEAPEVIFSTFIRTSVSGYRIAVFSTYKVQTV